MTSPSPTTSLPFTITGAESREVARRDVLPAALNGIPYASPGELVCTSTLAQPGAGKNFTTAHLLSGAVHADDDWAKAFHPYFGSVSQVEPSEARHQMHVRGGEWKAAICAAAAGAPELLVGNAHEWIHDPELAAEAGRMTREAQNPARSVVLQGLPFGEAEIQAQTDFFKNAGYKNELRVPAVRPELSKLRMTARYVEGFKENTGVRYANHSIHDVDCLPHIVPTLEVAERYMDRVLVVDRHNEPIYDRDGEDVVYHADYSQSTTAADVVRQVHEGPWGNEETQEYVDFFSRTRKGLQAQMAREDLDEFDRANLRLVSGELDELQESLPRHIRSQLEGPSQLPRSVAAGVGQGQVTVGPSNTPSTATPGWAPANSQRRM